MSVKVVLTPWVTHDGGAIYSLDASPNEYKLATSGNVSLGFRVQGIFFKITAEIFG